LGVGVRVFGFSGVCFVGVLVIEVVVVGLDLDGKDIITIFVQQS
jgi:hypothetical protein